MVIFEQKNFWLAEILGTIFSQNQTGIYLAVIVFQMLFLKMHHFFKIYIYIYIYFYPTEAILQRILLGYI